MKLEALKRQGKRSDLTLSQFATKLDTASAVGQDAGESRDTVYRYIRLTKLIPELLQLMDEEKIAFSVGVELSYLSENHQRGLFEIIDRDNCTPSYSQHSECTVRLRIIVWTAVCSKELCPRKSPISVKFLKSRWRK